MKHYRDVEMVVAQQQPAGKTEMSHTPAPHAYFCEITLPLETQRDVNTDKVQSMFSGSISQSNFKMFVLKHQEVIRKSEKEKPVFS